MANESHGKTDGTGQWESVVAPFSCSFYSISAAGGQTFDKCSNPNDAKTAVDGLGNFEVISSPVSANPRWHQGEIITYVRSSAPLNLYFLK